MKYKTLRPIKDTPQEFVPIEDEIVRVLKEQIYAPLMRQLPKKDQRKIKNAVTDDLIDAIITGRLYYFREGFAGDFDANLSKELKEMGAVWDQSRQQWCLPLSLLSPELRDAISASQKRWEATIAKIDKKLAEVSPQEIIEKMKLDGHMDTALFSADRKFKATTQSIVVTPDLSEEARKKIAKEYTENLKRYIKDWGAEEIVKLRKQVVDHVYSGNRYEQLAINIQDKYWEGQRKARFLARQETNLMTAKFKEARYADAGIKQYIWRCVAGSAKHPVRPMHKQLNGTIQRFDKPPVTNPKGQRNNPGEDFNCRCTAIPIVRFE